MAERPVHYWLMKSEPEVYSIDDLKRDKVTLWSGVRNYQARNYMLGRRKTAELVGEAHLEKKKLALSMLANDPLTMEIGDFFLFYHSNAEPPGCAGVGQIRNVGVVDPDQFVKKHDSFDPKATTIRPLWFCCEVSFQSRFKRFVTLTTLRTDKKLSSLVLLQKGSRLSVQPLTEKEFKHIVELGEAI